MGTIVLMSLTMILATSLVGGREPSQARGYEEDPWSMSPQPEILIVKEKGGSSSSASSGMSMKDLTPIICLLAPLLLAAILLPAKMSMMMNGMMVNPLTSMQNGFVLPNRVTPISAFLSSGGGMANNNPLGFPIFKSFIESKKFSGDGEHRNGLNTTDSPDSFTREHIQNDPEYSERNNSLFSPNLQDQPFLKNSIESQTFFRDAQRNHKINSSSVPNEHVKNVFELAEEHKQRNVFSSNGPDYKFLTKRPETNQLKHDGYKRNKGDSGNDEWISRVWSKRMSHPSSSLAEDILKLFDEISNLI